MSNPDPDKEKRLRIIASVAKNRGKRLRARRRKLSAKNRELLHNIGTYGTYLMKEDLTSAQIIVFTDMLQGYTVAYNNNQVELAKVRRSLAKVKSVQEKTGE